MKRPLSQPRRIVLGQTVGWRVRELMQAKGFRNISELHRCIKAIDPDAINFSQFASFVGRVPERISVRTLVALSLALQTPVGELLDISDRRPPDR